jgi:hypothetical protein
MTSKTGKPQKDFNQLYSDWFQMQQQLWEWYLAPAKDANLPAWPGMFEQSLAMSEKMVDSALKTQADWAHQFYRTLIDNSDETTPAGLWLQNMDALVDRWSETERQWFEMWLSGLRRQPSAAGAGQTGAAMGNWWKTWQDTLQKSLETQAALTHQLLSGMEAAPAEKTTAKTVSAKAATS